MATSTVIFSDLIPYWSRGCFIQTFPAYPVFQAIRPAASSRGAGVCRAETPAEAVSGDVTLP